MDMHPTTLTSFTGAADPKAIADLIRTSPAAAERFQQSYLAALEDAGDSTPRLPVPSQPTGTAPACGDLVAEIVSDLLEQTVVWSTDGRRGVAGGAGGRGIGRLAESHTAAARTIPEDQRPQVTGTAALRHITADASPLVLSHLAHSQNRKHSQRRRRFEYHMFQQGLDVLDLDPTLYAIIDTNPDSIGAWLPALHAAAEAHTFFRIPKTTIARVPLPLLQLTRIDYETINATTHQILNDWARQAFHLTDDGDYFIKTGTFSSKFDFRNARVTTPSEVAELGDYLLYVHQQALSMASPLNETPVVGAGTTTQWVVREFIEDPEHNPTIYHGLPLRTEFRVFVDADTNEVLSVVPYWDPVTMKRRFSEWDDADHPDNRHDLVTYMAAEPELMARYERHRGTVVAQVEALLPDLALTGQWSIDVMLSGGTFWLIDMAQAQSSAFGNSIPRGKRRPVEPDWLPRGFLSLEPRAQPE